MRAVKDSNEIVDADDNRAGGFMNSIKRRGQTCMPGVLIGLRGASKQAAPCSCPLNRGAGRVRRFDGKQ